MTFGSLNCASLLAGVGRTWTDCIHRRHHGESSQGNAHLIELLTTVSHTVSRHTVTGANPGFQERGGRIKEKGYTMKTCNTVLLYL